MAVNHNKEPWEQDGNTPGMALLLQKKKKKLPPVFFWNLVVDLKIYFCTETLIPVIGYCNFLQLRTLATSQVTQQQSSTEVQTHLIAGSLLLNVDSMFS